MKVSYNSNIKPFPNALSTDTFFICMRTTHNRHLNARVVKKIIIIIKMHTLDTQHKCKRKCTAVGAVTNRNNVMKYTHNTKCVKRFAYMYVSYSRRCK